MGCHSIAVYFLLLPPPSSLLHFSSIFSPPPLFATLLYPPPPQTSSFWPLKIITVFAPRLSACQSGFAAHQLWNAISKLPGKSHDEELLWNSRGVIHRRKSDPSCVKTLICRRLFCCAMQDAMLTKCDESPRLTSSLCWRPVFFSASFHKTFFQPYFALVF